MPASLTPFVTPYSCGWPRGPCYFSKPIVQSNVHSVEALVALGQGISCLTTELDLAIQEIGGCIQSVQAWVRIERPAYWKQQTALAERRLTEALEQLSQAQSSADPRNRPAATEAQQRVARAQRRLRLCQDKRIACRRQAAELDTVLLRLAGPVAAVSDRVQRGLPQARAELSQLVQILQSYMEQASSGSASSSAAAEDAEPDRPEDASA